MSFRKKSLDENTFIRVATKNDKEKLMSLWNECFPDESEGFTSWIFNERFVQFPEYCVCIETKGEIICAMQSYPLTMKIRNVNISSTIVGGVCSKQQYRGMGLMKKMFTYYMNYIKTLKISIVTYKPVDLNVYKSLTHYPITDSAKFELINQGIKLQNDEIKDININENLESLYECYRNFTQIKKYSCIINRSFEDFCLKMQDYQSDNMSCLSNITENNIKSYAIYKMINNSIYIEEFVSSYYNEYNILLLSICNIPEISTVNGKMPPDIIPFINLENFSYDISFQNLAGTVNVSDLLKNVIDANDYFHIDVKDEFVSENNNIFDLSGNIKHAITADFVINSGHLIQLICGYKTFYELIREGCIKINNENIYQKADEIFTKTSCFIVDEY